MKLNSLKKLFQEKRFEFIKTIHNVYPKATVFLVGGAVRDLLLQPTSYKLKAIQLDDLDFVVEGINKDELENFLEKNGIVKDVESRAFGVFIFVPKNNRHSELVSESDKSRSRTKFGMTYSGAESFDVALPRDEHWLGGGYKDIEVNCEGRTLAEDLSRRDFTINAMAINLRNFELIDEFKGQEDLKNKIIRTVGNPEDRFQEDPSRILRGARFAIQLDFKIEKKTLEAMKKMAAEIRCPLKVKSQNLKPKYRVAEEVIAKEFLKAFNKDPVKTIKLYDEVGLLKLLLPEVKAMQGVGQPKNFHSEGDVFTHTLLALKKLKNANLNLKLATLFHDIGKPATFTPPKDKNDRIHFNEHDEKGALITGRIIKRLKLSSFAKDGPLHVDRDVIVWLVRKHMILVTAKPEEMRLTTFEKYFFREDGAGEDLLALSWTDISATVPPSGKPDYSIYKSFIKKIDEVRAAVHAAKKERILPPPLINGNEVMKTLKIKSGPEVGEVLARVREEQLAGRLKNKKEALLFLSKDRYNKSDKDAQDGQPS